MGSGYMELVGCDRRAPRMGWDAMRATDRTMFVIPSFDRGEGEEGKKRIN